MPWRNGRPLDKVHDFEGSGLHIEVKETMMQPPSVYISMIQVAPFEGDKELQLIVVGLERGDEISLRKAVSNSRKIFSDSAHSVRLEHVLRRAGYRDEHASYYSRKYTITFVRSHRITEDSPVLNPSVLGDIPSTVSNIRYNLEVHAMKWPIWTRKHGQTSTLYCDSMSMRDNKQREAAGIAELYIQGRAS